VQAGRGGGRAVSRRVRPVRPSKVVEIIFWHTIRMRDEYRSIQPRCNPEDIDLAAIKADLEFLMEQGRAAADPLGVSLQTTLRDDRLCRARHRLVRDFLAALPLKPLRLKLAVGSSPRGVLEGTSLSIV
jgi:hypothetical protein